MDGISYGTGKDEEKWDYITYKIYKKNINFI